MSTTNAEHNQDAGNVATEERSADTGGVAAREVCPTCNQRMPIHGGHPNLVWVVRRVWEAGYMSKRTKVYFDTIRSIIEQAGLDVDAADIRSALEMGGCPVERDTVYESDLASFFRELDEEGKAPSRDSDAGNIATPVPSS